MSGNHKRKRKRRAMWIERRHRSLYHLVTLLGKLGVHSVRGMGAELIFVAGIPPGTRLAFGTRDAWSATARIYEVMRTKQRLPS